MEDSKELADLWTAIMDWADRTGSAPLNKYPGILSVPLADGFEMHLNGHQESRKAVVDGVEMSILPFHVVIAKTGYIGMVYANPHEGSIFGSHTMAPVIEAIKRTSTKREEPKR